MSVYIRTVSYGRTFAAAKQLCDGEKPDDTAAPEKDCMDEAVQTNVMELARSDCHDQFSCQWQVPSLPMDASCDGLKRETRVEHICGEFFGNVYIQTFFKI